VAVDVTVDVTVMKSRRILNLGMLGALSLSLAACGGGGLKDALGYGKDAPDEFAIVTKAPLVIPPDFSLRPPQPGAPRPQEAMMQPHIAAETALTGGAGTVAATDSSPGEQVLLNHTGGAEADPRIRQVVNAETRSLVEKDKTFADQVLFWRERTPPDERVVDPKAEARRIQQNDAQGKTVTEGDTPQLKPEKKGLFDGIF